MDMPPVPVPAELRAMCIIYVHANDAYLLVHPLVCHSKLLCLTRQCHCIRPASFRHTARVSDAPVGNGMHYLRISGTYDSYQFMLLAFQALQVRVIVLA